jgi:hypothetical protein
MRVKVGILAGAVAVALAVGTTLPARAEWLR